VNIVIAIFLARIVTMNRIKTLSFLLVLGVIFFACGEGRQDPLGPDPESGLTEGRLNKGTDGPNLAVTDTNLDSAIQTVDEAVFVVFPKASDAVMTDPSIKEALRMMGDYDGYAVVDGSATFADTSIENNLRLTLYDYSDDGLIYLGGSLQFQGFIYLNWGVTRSVRVNGKIKFAGPYNGFIEYNNFLLPTDEGGNLVSIFASIRELSKINRGGSVTVISGENEFRLINPYPVPKE
jgi:hypothetical protein